MNAMTPLSSFFIKIDFDLVKKSGEHTIVIMIDSWLKIFLSGFQPEKVYWVNLNPRALPGALLLKPFRLTLLKNLCQSSENIC